MKGVRSVGYWVYFEKQRGLPDGLNVGGEQKKSQE